jgi:hypothetical protein
VRELHGLSSLVDVSQRSVAPSWVDGGQSVVVTGSGNQGADHFGGTSSTKVPVVGRFVPGTIRKGALETVGFGIRHSSVNNPLSDTSGVLGNDSECGHSETSVANTVPVSVDWRSSRSNPPVRRAVAFKRSHTEAQTKIEDGPHEGVALILCPEIIEPVITNSESSTELGKIEEVGSVPSGTVGAERNGGVVTSGSLILVLRAESRTTTAHLKFEEDSVGIFGFVGDPVCVGPVLDPDLHSTGNVQDTGSRSKISIRNVRERVFTECG